MTKDYKSLHAELTQDQQYQHSAIGDKYYLCTGRHDKSPDRFAMACQETVLIRLTGCALKNASVLTAGRNKSRAANGGDFSPMCRGRWALFCAVVRDLAARWWTVGRQVTPGCDKC